MAGSNSIKIEKMSMKKRLMKIAVEFFCLMLIFTILSRTMYKLGSAVVQTTIPDEQTITHEVEGYGQVEYTQERAISIPEGLLVDTVYVSEGSYIKSGDGLFKINEDDIEATVKKFVNEQKVYEMQIKEAKSGENENGLNSSSVQEIRNSYEEVKEKLSKLNDILRAKGNIYADADGMVTTINIHVGERSSGTADILLADVSKKLKITAKFSNQDKMYLNKGAVVNIEADDGKVKLEKLKISNVHEDKDGNDSLEAVIELPKHKLEIGQQVSVHVITKSNTYETCIPLAALHEEEGNKFYLYTVENEETVLGEEARVQKVDVKLLDKNNSFAAVEGVLGSEEVIFDSSRNLEEGTKVRRAEE